MLLSPAASCVSYQCMDALLLKQLFFKSNTATLAVLEKCPISSSFSVSDKKKDNTYNIGTEWPQMVVRSYNNKATISIRLVGMTCVVTISMTWSFFHSQGG